MSSQTLHTRRRSRQRFDRTFLAALIGATILIIVAVIAFVSMSSRPATPATAGATDAPALADTDLLPLAEPVAPISGFHDMNHLPGAPVPTQTVTEGASRAKVDLPVSRWDWGTIPKTPPVRQIFPIQNTGDKPLLIASVVTSCGCTTADLTSSVIPPGQRADLVVTFDPNYHEASGPVTRLVWLETNDPEMPLVELRADANVVP